MAAIKGKNTKPELAVRRFLHGKGLRYSLHKKALPGKPDMVFVSRRTVLFVHGCFWHGHQNCKHFRLPKTRTEWWKQKIEATKLRDQRNEAVLHEDGWRVLRIWECEIKTDNLEALFYSIVSKQKF